MPALTVDTMTFKTYDLAYFPSAVDSTELAKAPISPLSIMKVPAAYDYHALGIFCKFDVGLDKGSKIPLRFRLGTVGGVDEQERKGPTRYNY